MAEVGGRTIWRGTSPRGWAYHKDAFRAGWVSKKICQVTQESSMGKLKEVGGGESALLRENTHPVVGNLARIVISVAHPTHMHALQIVVYLVLVKSKPCRTAARPVPAAADTTANRKIWRREGMIRSGGREHESWGVKSDK